MQYNEGRLINVTQYTSAQSILFLSEACLRIKYIALTYICVTLIELQAHRDAFIRNRRNVNWIRDNVHGNCLLKHVIIGKIDGAGRRGKRRKHLMNDLENILDMK